MKGIHVPLHSTCLKVDRFLLIFFFLPLPPRLYFLMGVLIFNSLEIFFMTQLLLFLLRKCSFIYTL